MLLYLGIRCSSKQRILSKNIIKIGKTMRNQGFATYVPAKSGTSFIIYKPENATLQKAGRKQNDPKEADSGRRLLVATGRA